MTEFTRDAPIIVLAAGFVRLASAVGALTVELNLGPATEIVPAFVDSLLSARG